MTSNGTTNIADELADLAELHRTGAISDAEFAAAKAMILRNTETAEQVSLKHGPTVIRVPFIPSFLAQAALERKVIPNGRELVHAICSPNLKGERISCAHCANSKPVDVCLNRYQFDFTGSHQGHFEPTRASWNLFIGICRQCSRVFFDSQCIQGGCDQTVAFTADQTIAFCTESIRQDPRQPDAFEYRAMAYVKKGQLEFALSDFQSAMRLSPNKQARHYTGCAAIFDMTRDHSSALAYFAEALRLDPRDYVAYSNRGALHKKLGYWDKAIADYDEAIRINTNFADAWRNRALTYADLGQHDLAISDLCKAITIDPNYAQAYYDRGVFYYKRGMIAQAVGDWTETTRLAPDHAAAYYNRAIVRNELGEHQEAIIDYNIAIRLDPRLDKSKQ